MQFSNGSKLMSFSGGNPPQPKLFPGKIRELLEYCPPPLPRTVRSGYAPVKIGKHSVSTNLTIIISVPNNLSARKTLCKFLLIQTFRTILRKGC